MCWWYWAPGISSIPYIFCWLSWEVSGFLSGFLSFMDCSRLELILLTELLPATIWDKGLCPCPQCLIPKLKLDKTGMKRDSKFRLQNNRTYLFDRVLIARNAIYNSTAAIAGAAINRLLKATSSIGDHSLSNLISSHLILSHHIISHSRSLCSCLFVDY